MQQNMIGKFHYTLQGPWRHCAQHPLWQIVPNCIDHFESRIPRDLTWILTCRIHALMTNWSHENLQKNNCTCLYAGAEGWQETSLIWSGELSFTQTVFAITGSHLKWGCLSLDLPSKNHQMEEQSCDTLRKWLDLVRAVLFLVFLSSLLRRWVANLNFPLADWFTFDG